MTARGNGKAPIGLREVADAAGTLTVHGKPVTLRAVRDALGGRGSMATILKYLKAWKCGEQPAAEAEHMPNTLAEVKQCLVEMKQCLAEVHTEQRRQASMFSQQTGVLSELMRLAKATPQPKKRTPPPIITRTDPLPTPEMPPELPATLPADLESLKRVATAFAMAFSGAEKPEMIEKYVPAYTDALAVCRQRQATTRQAWDAFMEAMHARGKVLFGGARAALSYLPGWRALREPACRTTETVLPD
jgi:hypothetical protein